MTDAQPRGRRSAFTDAAALRHFESELLESDIQLPPRSAAEPAGPRRSAHAEGAALRHTEDDDGRARPRA
jgi:hypothetical protein